jgi:hypothetical protein
VGEYANSQVSIAGEARKVGDLRLSVCHLEWPYLVEPR